MVYGGGGISGNFTYSFHICTHHKDKSFSAALIFAAGFDELWNERFWKPECHSGHQHPEDADLIQKLSKQGQGRVEVGWRQTDNPEKKPHANDS